MRISLILLFCLIIVVVNSAAPKPPPRATTKAPARKSAYAYLRTVRGSKSCASGTCPFWERHGRSFVSLRCYAQEYKDCTCLHRMCYSSCLFERSTCDAEMVSCLQQICRRCMPASSTAICSAYDLVATQVVNSLKTFTCYACCPFKPNTNSNATKGPNTNTVTTTPPRGNVNTSPANSGPGAGTNGGSGSNTINRPPNGPNSQTPGNVGPISGSGNNFGVFPGSGNANAISNNNGNNNNNNVPVNGNSRVKKLQVQQHDV